MRCTASVEATEGMPDLAGPAAEQGSVYHAMASASMMLGVDAYWLLGWKPFDDIEFTVDEEMVDSFLPVRNRIEFLSGLPGAITLIETPVDISYWTRPEEFGTADVIVIVPAARKMFVIDHKYGMVPVNPRDSFQTRGYALGAWWLYGPMYFGFDADVMIDMVIEQPRVFDRPRVHTMSLRELLAFGKYVYQRASTIGTPEAEFAPSDKTCTWCPIQETCSARTGWILDSMQLPPERIDAMGDKPSFPILSMAQKSKLVLMRSEIRKWLDQIHGHVLEEARTGRPTPGVRLSRGRRPKRIWNPALGEKVQETLVYQLGDEAFTEPVPVSPAVAEKALGKELFDTWFSALVSQGEAKYILVPEDSDAPRIADSIGVRPENWEI